MKRLIPYFTAIVVLLLTVLAPCKSFAEESKIEPFIRGGTDSSLLQNEQQMIDYAESKVRSKGIVRNLNTTCTTDNYIVGCDNYSENGFEATYNQNHPGANVDKTCVQTAIAQLMYFLKGKGKVSGFSTAYDAYEWILDYSIANSYFNSSTGTSTSAIQYIYQAALSHYCCTGGYTYSSCTGNYYSFICGGIGTGGSGYYPVVFSYLSDATGDYHTMVATGYLTYTVSYQIWTLFVGWHSETASYGFLRVNDCANSGFERYKINDFPTSNTSGYTAVKITSI
ncbi:MAG: hypothetical protein J5912_05485 [Clostridia bacterium]|nr:hypothetical protein [Clostridia bacterium]